jgi:hypothetical protein
VSGPAIVGVGQYDIDDVALTPPDGSAVDTLENFVHKMSWQRVPIAGPPETRIVSLTPSPMAGTRPRLQRQRRHLPDGRAMVVAY